MACSRKHYRDVAETLRQMAEHGATLPDDIGEGYRLAVADVTRALVTFFADDNPRFSASTFRAAARADLA